MPHANIIESEPALEAIVKSAKSVAVVGIKGEADAAAPAHEIPRRVQARGLRVVPVNPKLEQTLGEKAYPSLAAMPERVDVVDVFRRSEAIPEIAKEVLALPAERRPGVFWMQTGIKNDEAAELLAAAGIQVVQDRCLGVYSERYREKA